MYRYRHSIIGFDSVVTEGKSARTLSDCKIAKATGEFLGDAILPSGLDAVDSVARQVILTSCGFKTVRYGS